MERDRTRLERLRQERFGEAGGKSGGKSTKKKKRGRFFKSPYIIVAGFGVFFFIFSMVSRFIWTDAEEERYVAFGGRFYYEYSDGEAENPPSRDSLILLGELYESKEKILDDFAAYGFDLGLLLAINGADRDEWLVVYYNGEYYLMKAEEE